MKQLKSFTIEFQKHIKNNKMDFEKYINFKQIVEDFDLATGDLSPQDYYKLQTIFENFVEENTNENNFRR